MDTIPASDPDHKRANDDSAAPQPSDFGLTDDPLPADPVEAQKRFNELDAADAQRDKGTFALRCRRARRLDQLRGAKAHRLHKLTWEEFLARYVPGGYDAWSRYHAVANVQEQLHKWDLTLVASEAVARVLVPRLKDHGAKEKIAAVLEANGGKYPSSRELAKALAPKRRKKKANTNDVEAHLVAALECEGLLVEERTSIAAALERLRAAHPRKSRQPPKGAQENFDFGG